jgi:hypothetical protein
LVTLDQAGGLIGAGPDSTTELLPGLVERVPFYNPENGFCVPRVSLVWASLLSRDEGTATGRGLIHCVEQGRVGLYQPDRLHGEICRNHPITEEQHGTCCAVADRRPAAIGTELHTAKLHPYTRIEIESICPLQARTLWVIHEVRPS